MYGPSLDYLPLQAADILANEGYRVCGKLLAGNPKDEVLKENPILEWLGKGGSPFNFVVYDKQQLEFDLEKRVHDPARY